MHQFMNKREQHDEEFSFKNYFLPFTTSKAIHFLILIGFLVFANSLFNGFVMDDQGLILGNHSVQRLNVFSLFQGSVFGYGDYTAGIYYRPMQNTYFSVLYNIAGEQAFLYHLSQVMLHIANSVLVFGLFKRYLHKHISFILAVIFMVHPIQTETVAYIACTQDILFVFWGLLFLTFLPRFLPTVKWMWIPFLMLLLSILSKESGILFLLIGFVYLILFEKKKRVIAGSLALGAVLLIYVLIRFGIGGIGLYHVNEFSMMRLSFTERLIHIPAILFYYLKTFFFPLHLIEVQSWTISSVTISNFFVPLGFITIFFSTLLGMCYWTWKKTHDYRVPLFFGLWLIVGLGFHIQLIPLDVTVADRWFYFPIIGLLGLLGYLFQQIKGTGTFKKVPLRTLSICLIALIISLLSYRTILRNFDWKDTKTLALHDLELQKDNDRLLSSLGAVYLEEQNYEKAIYYLKQSTDLYPHWGVSMYNLAVSYHKSNRPDEAKIYYEKAIKNAPQYINAYENMAILLLHSYSPDQAKVYTQDALKKFPNSTKLQQVLFLSEQKLASSSATEAQR